MIRPRHASFFSALAICAAALTVAVAASAQPSSSYFMVQGPLTPGGAYETYKFRVEYNGVLNIPGFDAGDQNTGLALLAAIYGPGSNTVNQVYSNNVGGVTINASGLLLGFRMDGGSMVMSGPAYPDDPQWNYHVSGGSYISVFPGFPTTTGDYDDDAWTYSFTGLNGRILTNGSIDAWSYAAHEYSYTDPDWGDIFFPPLPSNVEPTLGDFTGPMYAETKVSADGLSYTVYRIMAVPEPGRVLFLLVGMGVVFARRSRKTFV